MDKFSIKEAEIYRAQGLYREALEIYENIEKHHETDEKSLKTIKIATELIKDEIKLVESDDSSLSDEDISLLRSGWEGDSKFSETLDSAAAFKELGLYKEALGEYERILSTSEECLQNEILKNLIDCLLAIGGPLKVIEKLDEIIEYKKFGDYDKSLILSMAGNEMESAGFDDISLLLWKEAVKIFPDVYGVQEKIDSFKGQQVYESRYSYLIDSKKITTTQLQSALASSKKLNKSVEQTLIEQFGIDKEDVGTSLSLFYKVPFKSFDDSSEVPVELLTKLKKPFLSQNRWVPLGWDISDKSIDIFIDNPKDIIRTDAIFNLFNVKKINFFVGIAEDIYSTIDYFYGQKAEVSKLSTEDINIDKYDSVPEIEFEEEEDPSKNIQEEVTEASGQIVRLVDHILISAYRKGASDIHIEPSTVTKSTMIRYRIDGVCQEVLQVPNTHAKAILSRLKIMSNLNIAEKRLPQDGKIKFNRKGIKPFELRIATLPTAGETEDAVLRILADSGAIPLDNMGMNERNLSILKKVVQHPYGLILVVGPTGSGKTTTLHAALNYINKPGIKIWTAEDPVEITQKGLRQVECKPKIGLDFARVMRAFLRADPDVIMIGEMRDYETAHTGIEASLTGHLVFSTLHTNSAPETITRLLDMGLNPLNFSDAFQAVLAQRLVRRLCKNCIVEYNASEEEVEDILIYYGEEELKGAGISFNGSSSLYRSTGCEKCFGSGYKGRMGIHEMLEGSKPIKRMIKRQSDTEQLFEQAASEGMITLKQDGIIKALSGLTDIKEIRRACSS